jgi:hypothetical protein
MMKKILLPLIFSLISLGLSAQICNYKFRKRITFDPTKVAGSADLTNFPALISITTDNDLKLTPTGHVQNSNGYDIIFTADDGVTLLDFQLEKYTSGTGLLTAWVKIPTLSTSINTYIYMYYGNSAITTDQSTPANVWANYYGVWHLGGGATTYTTDNSGNGNTLTDYSTTNQSPAMINDGRKNNGSQDLDVASSFPNITTNFTISGWAYTTDNTMTGQRIFCDDLNNTGGYALSIGDGGTGMLRFYSRGSTTVILDSPNLISNNTWYYCVGVADITAGTKSIYINGVLAATQSGTTGWGTDAGVASIAGEANGSSESANRLKGRIDEVHIARTALSSDWIATEYNNQNSPSTFYSVSTEPYVWSGATSVNWTTNTNWVGSVLPPTDADIIIPSTGVTNQPTLNGNVQIGALWMQNGTTLSFNANKVLSVRYDITNCGTITGGGNGGVNFNSTSSYIQNQYISGTGTYSINDLTVNNTFSTSPTLTLKKNVTASGTFTPTSGIIYTTTTNILDLTSTATAGSTGSASSFVSGPMTKAGTSAYVFPVGKGTSWRRIAIGAPSSSTTFRAEYFNASYSNVTSVTSPLTDVSSMEYWVLDQTVGTGNATVTLYWENATASGINNCADLTVAHWTGTSWDEKPATASGTCSGAGTGSVLTNAVVTTFSPFTFGSKTNSVNPLPVELLSFDAEPCGGKVCTSWTTASEQNNDFFSVERSPDGISFEIAGIVDGAGTSTSVLNYAYTDNTPYSGISYYRLKQTDNNGDFTYSAVRMVNLVAQLELTMDVFPNPNDGSEIQVKLAGPGEEVLVVVYDASGRESYSKVIVTGGAETVYAIDPSGKLAPGLYLITAGSEDKFVSKKLIIK